MPIKIGYSHITHHHRNACTRLGNFQIKNIIEIRKATLQKPYFSIALSILFTIDDIISGMI